MSLHFAVPLVGMHFRPPAKVILAALRGGTKLKIVPEPSNPYDPNALMVWVESSAIPQSQHEDLKLSLPGYGFDLDQVLAQAEWHLGYVARAQAEELAPHVRELYTEEQLMLDDQPTLEGTLAFDMAGKPLVELEL